MSQSPAQNGIPAGRVISEKYKLLRPLGSGGMGAVYEAEHTWTTRRVAVKLMRSEYSQDEVAVQRFLQEAKSATLISHPNIVQVLDMGRDPEDGSLYIVQELMSGLDLRDRLDQSRRISLGEALDVLVPIMGALVAASRRGIVHRDIKPENIFLATDGDGLMVPKLIDFGVSKIVDSTDRRALTHSGMAIGTPYYMSPEQARGDVEIDSRTDVWALGIVLFEALAGHCPFDAATHNLVMLKVMTEKPPRIELSVPDISRAFAEILHRAIEPDRNKRYQSMQTFLEAVLQHASASQDPQVRSLAARHEPSLRALADGGQRANQPATRFDGDADLEHATIESRPNWTELGVVAPGSERTDGRSSTVSIDSNTAVAARTGGHWKLVAGMVALAALALTTAVVVVPRAMVSRVDHAAATATQSTIALPIAPARAPSVPVPAIAAPVDPAAPVDIAQDEPPRARNQGRPIARGRPSGSTRAGTGNSARGGAQRQGGDYFLAPAVSYPGGSRVP